MRRRLSRLLPLVILALLVQIIAPIGVCWAASIVASDPLHDAAICSSSSTSSTSADADKAAHHQRDGSCSACCTTCTPVPLTPAHAEVGAVSRHVYRVAWRAYEPDAMAARAASSGQARAPPQSI
jgi:hypothetical protein